MSKNNSLNNPGFGFLNRKVGSDKEIHLGGEPIILTDNFFEQLKFAECIAKGLYLGNINDIIYHLYIENSLLMLSIVIKFVI